MNAYAWRPHVTNNYSTTVEGDTIVNEGDEAAVGACAISKAGDAFSPYVHSQDCSGGLE